MRIREVGPRDGFQNEPETIPAAEKVRLIDLLSGSGLTRLEVTSFVRPDVIPQLSDAEEVLSAVQRRDGVSFSVLIPNERGLERALHQRDRFDVEVTEGDRTICVGTHERRMIDVGQLG